MSFPEGHRVMVTGHRNIRGDQADLIRGVLRKILERFQVRHAEGVVAVCGMAVGADAEFADAAIGLGIPLVAAVPVETQADPWPPEAQHRYARFLAQACYVVEVWKEPAYVAREIGAKMHARNRWMLDHSDTVIAVWDGKESGGGTWNTVREARRGGRKVLVVDSATGVLRVDVPPTPRSRMKRLSFGAPYGEGVLDMFGDATYDVGVMRDLELKALMAASRYKPIFIDDIDQMELRIRMDKVRGDKPGHHDDLVDAARCAQFVADQFRGVDSRRRNG